MLRSTTNFHLPERKSKRVTGSPLQKGKKTSSGSTTFNLKKADKLVTGMAEPDSGQAFGGKAPKIGIQDVTLRLKLKYQQNLQQ